MSQADAGSWTCYDLWTRAWSRASTKEAKSIKQLISLWQPWQHAWPCSRFCSCCHAEQTSALSWFVILTPKLGDIYSSCIFDCFRISTVSSSLRCQFQNDWHAVQCKLIDTTSVKLQCFRLYTSEGKGVSETCQSRAHTHLPAICVKFNITMSTLSLHGLATIHL